MNTRNRTNTGIILASLLVAGSLAPAPQDDAKTKVASLAKERIAAIRKALVVVSEMQKSGQPVIGESVKWTRRLVEATRQTDAPKSELVAALREAVQAAEAYEEQAKALTETGRITMLAYLEVKDVLLEMKIALAQVEAK